MTVRVRAGAPNEDRYGFSQAVARGGVVAIAGQVGKDNATGAMVGEVALAPQLRRAVANVREAARLAGSDPPALTAVTAHVVGPADSGADELRRALGPGPPAVTVVSVPALSHDVYLAELSASARTDSSAPMRHLDTGPATLPWAPAAVVAGDDVHVSACHGHGPEPGAALRDALDAVGAVLARAGCTLEDVLSEHVYVVGPVPPDGFAAICDAHRDAYGSAGPASTLVLVAGLHGGATVAVSATARRPG